MDVVVECPAGALRGQQRADHCEFVGIRYGTAERFRPGVPAQWSGVADATAFAPVCPQPSHGAAYQQGNQVPREFLPSADATMGEDCLSLNLWTPAADDKRRPVMVYFHGGAMVFGAGGGAQEPASITNGDRLAPATDTVVITVNHRLGFLGFSVLDDALGPEFEQSGNVGLLDIVLALEWVRDNVAAFGGDPDCVTVFGHSGGASKVIALLVMREARGLFHRAGMIAGNLKACMTRDEAIEARRELLAELGHDPDDVAALLSIPVEQIVAGHTALMKRAGGLMQSGLRGMIVNPIIDGLVFDRHPQELLDSGAAADVPILASFSREEFAVHLYGDPGYGSFTEDDLLLRARVFLGDDAEAAIAAYRAARPQATRTELAVSIMGDSLIVLPVMAVVDRVLPHNQSSAWAAMFTWPLPALHAAYHGGELPFVFDTVDRHAGMAHLPADYPLIARTRDAWAAFARTGDPNHPGLPSWPPYSLAERQTMVLDDQCHVESDPIHLAREHNRPYEPDPSKV